MSRRCHKCGGTMVRQAREGRTTRYQAMNVPIPSDLELTECQGCGLRSVSKEDGEAIAKASAEFYSQELRRRSKRIIEGLATYRTQWSIERLLGLSHGYLSRLKNGQKLPSTGLMSTLALIAIDPESRFEELERFWGVGNLDQLYEEMQEEWRRDEDGAYHISKERGDAEE